MCYKLIQLAKQDHQRVVFHVGREKKSYPSSIVRTFTNIRANSVKVNDKYHIQEVMNLFEILMNLPSYVCEGVLRDYSEWKPISNFVNMLELAKLFGMDEVESYLNRLAELFTEHNKIALENELRRRKNPGPAERTESKNNPETVAEKQRRPRSRSRSRSRSLTSYIKRSLSRNRKEEKD